MHVKQGDPLLKMLKFLKAEIIKLPAEFTSIFPHKFQPFHSTIDTINYSSRIFMN